MPGLFWRASWAPPLSPTTLTKDAWFGRTYEDFVLVQNRSKESRAMYRLATRKCGSDGRILKTSREFCDQRAERIYMHLALTSYVFCI